MFLLSGYKIFDFPLTLSYFLCRYYGSTGTSIGFHRKSPPRGWLEHRWNDQSVVLLLHHHQVCYLTHLTETITTVITPTHILHALFFFLKNIHIEWAKIRVRVGQGFGKTPVLHWILDWRALSHDLLLCLANVCTMLRFFFLNNRPMAKEKGLTVIVDSRKSAPSELCLSALKLFKVSQCTDCLWSSWHFILILNLFFSECLCRLVFNRNRQQQALTRFLS